MAKIHASTRGHLAGVENVQDRVSGESSIPPTASKHDLRGEAESLLEQIKLIYSMSHERDSQLTPIRLQY